ncbi:hypothetical protein [Amycolatopsis sp. H20-H5]|nr:hypothetical protein [Amycolatopsis sp. H20-H5]MEC3975006.1 hypothetical protein [Amycolatopsis sp. H20-H5]
MSQTTARQTSARHRALSPTPCGSSVEFFVNGGWRSPGYQERLLQQAISK